MTLLSSEIKYLCEGEDDDSESSRRALATMVNNILFLFLFATFWVRLLFKIFYFFDDFCSFSERSAQMHISGELKHHLPRTSLVRFMCLIIWSGHMCPMKLERHFCQVLIFMRKSTQKTTLTGTTFFNVWSTDQTEHDEQVSSAQCIEKEDFSSLLFRSAFVRSGYTWCVFNNRSSPFK